VQFQAEREDLLDDYRSLTQQIKLKNLIIACFVPPVYQEVLLWQGLGGMPGRGTDTAAGKAKVAATLLSCNAPHAKQRNLLHCRGPGPDPAAGDHEPRPLG
jgi:hypothetical protein